MRAGGRGAGALRHSIKRQLAVVFIAVMTGLIFACWLANSLFLEKYYISNKGKSMMEAYMVVNRAVGEEDIYSDAFQRKLEGVLTEEEQDVFRRGRNTSPHTIPKAASREEYQTATALEALFGYLYLQGRTDRLNELFTLMMEE